jgi:hypothetical protein
VILNETYDLVSCLIISTQPNVGPAGIICRNVDIESVNCFIAGTSPSESLIFIILMYQLIPRAYD